MAPIMTMVQGDPAEGPIRREYATLLVVDDEPDIVASLRSYIEQELPNIRVVAAQNAQEALEVLRREAVDLALVDYRLPRTNGLELLREIHALKPDLPAVLITAYPDLSVVSDAWNLSLASGFLTKPLDLERLKSVIRRLVERRSGNLRRIPPSR